MCVCVNDLLSLSCTFFSSSPFFLFLLRFLLFFLLLLMHALGSSSKGEHITKPPPTPTLKNSLFVPGIATSFAAASQRCTELRLPLAGFHHPSLFFENMLKGKLGGCSSAVGARCCPTSPKPPTYHLFPFFEKINMLAHGEVCNLRPGL